MFSKKEIRLQETKKNFVVAAKELLIDQGVNQVSVRKIADKVGYSYATIYNHFKDLNELLCFVKYEITNDISRYMISHNKEKIESIDDIKYINRLHVSYFNDNKHIFEFFFNYKLMPSENEPVYLDNIEKKWQSQYNCFVEQGKIEAKDIEIIAKTLIYSINGILSILSTNHKLSADDLCEDLDRIVDLLIGKD